MDLTIVPKKLKEVREQKGVTQKTLAEDTGLSQPTIARYEAGAIPPLEALNRIADALGVEVVLFLS
jgi:transcriptional regulator with XRE-family HTH domain